LSPALATFRPQVPCSPLMRSSSPSMPATISRSSPSARGPWWCGTQGARSPSGSRTRGRSGLVPVPWRRLRPSFSPVPASLRARPQRALLWEASEAPPDAKGGLRVLPGALAFLCWAGSCSWVSGPGGQAASSVLALYSYQHISRAKSGAFRADFLREVGGSRASSSCALRPNQASIDTNKIRGPLVSGRAPSFGAGGTRAHPCNSRGSRPRSYRACTSGASGAGGSAIRSSYLPNTSRGRFGTSRAATFRATGKISARSR
jgi:hypothetical protein